MVSKVNNYVKIGKFILFFNDRNKVEKIRALGAAQTHKGIVYRRPDVMWDSVAAVGDGIGELNEVPEESSDAA